MSVVELLREALKQAEKEEEAEAKMDLDEILKGPGVRDFLPQWEILAQLAEECCELGQAALKVRRCLDGENPTRMGFLEAKRKLNEEWADVLLTIRQLTLLEPEYIVKVIREKEKRWIDSLKEHRKESERDV